MSGTLRRDQAWFVVHDKDGQVAELHRQAPPPRRRDRRLSTTVAYD